MIERAAARRMIAGVDIGTQSLKAVIADDHLRVLGEASIACEPDFPRAGEAEQDVGAWETAIGPAIAGALSMAGVRAAEVSALGVCGQLDGCIAVDTHGDAIGPCIIWMDRRAESEIADLPAGRVLACGGIVLDATHMGAKIRWQKRHLPGVERAVRFHQPVSYMVSRLTGRHVFDHGLASTTMLYDLQRRALDEQLLECFGISAAELPAIAHASDAAGALDARGAALTGLRAGITVAVGTGDDFSNPLGAGVVTPGRAVCTLGTAEVVGAVHDTALVDPRALVETHGFADGRYFIENPGWLSGGAVEWLVATCGLGDAATLDRQAAGVAPGAEGVVFLPALSGAMAPEWIASARGCFYGLTPAHGSAHLARAVLEGCAYAMRDVLDRLRELGVQFDSLVLLGGGARSRTWARIRADVSGLPVEIPAATDTSPIGAAMLAAVAAGLQPDLAHAAACVARETLRIEPDEAAGAALDTGYRRYRRLFESLKPMYAGDTA